MGRNPVIIGKARGCCRLATCTHHDDRERLERGVRLFNDRCFFECHEVLEEEWAPERGPRRLFLQSLIHLAVGLFHAQRGNSAGATGQLRKGLRKLAGYLPSCEGIDTARLHRDALVALNRIEGGAKASLELRIHMASNNDS